jgi:hypothetical protein
MSASSYAKAPVHKGGPAPVTVPVPGLCSIDISTGTVDGYGEASSELPLELEVIHSVGDVEFAPMSMNLVYGVPEAADEEGLLLATKVVARDGSSLVQICTQVTLLDVGPKGEDLVGYDCISVPLSCGMNGAPVASDVSLCLAHQPDLDGRCPEDAFSVVRFTYTFTNPEIDPSDSGMAPVEGVGDDAEERRCPACDNFCSMYGLGGRSVGRFEPRYPPSGNRSCTMPSGEEGTQHCYTQGFSCKERGSAQIGPFYIEICGECLPPLGGEASVESEEGGF